MCEANTLSYGQIFHEWHLGVATTDGHILEAGEWYLVKQNTPSFVWKTKPKAFQGDFSNLLKELVAGNYGKRTPSEMSWIQEARSFVKNIIYIGAPSDSHSLLQNFKEHLGLDVVTYTTNLLLYQYLGRIVEDFTPVR